jgi:hypothetical protein
MHLLFRLVVSLAALNVYAKEPVTPGPNFDREHLVAWCIVPFDALKRGPEARTKMLVTLGLKRCAYDWRGEHVARFEEEILQYRKHGVEFSAFWSSHERAFALFEQHGIHPDIWQTAPSPKEGRDEDRVQAAVKVLLPLAERVKAQGLRLGLYNHGGWGGEPANLVAVCKALHAQGTTRVGIVYNFHHGHGHVEDFKQVFPLMQPYLLCLNLNGMGERKIMTIGSGEHEAAMIRVVIQSGYTGPIGVLGHRADEDVKRTLEKNLKGLEALLQGLAE